VSDLPTIPRGALAPPPPGGGYASAEYAASLGEFGEPVALPRSGSWALLRATPSGDAIDAMGLYPLMTLHEPRGLREDLAELARRAVAFSAVIDPFASAASNDLRAALPDVFFEYKRHYARDLSTRLDGGADGALDQHHRRNIRKAARMVEVEERPLAGEALDAWRAMYANLVRRHAIQGIARFSGAAFESLAGTPGVRAFFARSGTECCGATLWIAHGGVAHYHLAAYSEVGYAASASYALFDRALRTFADEGFSWAALGSAAGVAAVDSGLTRFKRGWATHQASAYFGGGVLRPVEYAQLCSRTPDAGGYFPAYRAPSNVARSVAA
jgi:hypothetical protein